MESLRNIKGDIMIKKGLMCAAILIVRVGEWLLWPAAKAHSYLHSYGDQLCDKTTYL